jgi:Mg2+ and Co2+ transporter CorA
VAIERPGQRPAALARHLGEYADLIDRYDRQEDEAASVSEYFAVLEGMSPLSRTIRNLHAALQDAREKMPDDRDLINARDRAYELERSADLLLADVRNALEFAVAKKAEEQAATSHQMAVSSHRLNMLVAFFFPIATLTAVFGANLSHPLEQYLPPPYAFFAVLAAGLMLGCGLAGYLLSLSQPRPAQTLRMPLKR